MFKFSVHTGGRYVRIGTTSPIEKVRTTLIELLCSSAYDRLSVDRTHTETCKWFSWLATVTANRSTISFNDYPNDRAEAR